MTRVHVSGEEWYPVPHIMRNPPSGWVMRDIPDDVITEYERAQHTFTQACTAIWAAWEEAD